MLLCLSAHLPLYFFVIKYPETIIPKADSKANTTDQKIVFFCIYPYNDNVNCIKNTAEYGMMVTANQTKLKKQEPEYLFLFQLLGYSENDTFSNNSTI